MKYTVLYVPEAEEQLAQLWLDTEDRAAFSLASNEIDRRLAANPLDEGKSRASGLRIFLVPPLGVIYRVSPPDKTVHVVEIWTFTKRY